MGSADKLKVYNNVFDRYTDENLHKLAGRGLFQELKSSISLGKEANIFTASTKEDSVLIVKIYRIKYANFNKMLE